MSRFSLQLEQRLATIDSENRRRVRRPLQSPQQAVVTVNGEQKLNFCSNDYLGFANDPRLQAAFQRGMQQYGLGSGASSLVCGYSEAHRELERQLAAFTGRDRALLFNAGFQLNASLIPALLGGSGALFCDALNHASLIDGARLSKQRIHVYPHGDLASLEQQLADCDEPVKLVVSDAVFSMDGDIAPLADLARLTAKYEGWLLVDDAHGLGVLGHRGAGALDEAGLSQDEVPLLVGTFGKAFGMAGAFVAGPELAIELLLQTCRGQIFSTAMSPAQAVALAESLRLVQAADDRREHLQAVIQHFRDGAERLGIELLPSRTPIQPLVLGSEMRALAVSDSLWAQGCWVGAIRPPTVPVGTARLRIVPTAAHSFEQIDQLLAALQVALGEF